MVELLMVEVVQPMRRLGQERQRLVLETELDTMPERHMAMVVVMEVGFVVVMAVLELG
jgi:hypothetical protein